MFIFKYKVRNWLKDAEDEHNKKSSRLEEVQRVDHQKNLQDHLDEVKLQAQGHQRLIL